MNPKHTTLHPHAKDLGGGFVVRRLLPAAARQAVGPFLFFDHFGPIDVHPDDQHDVRPHPHIGLATVTYLFEGAMLHRDSTGAVQRIEPGAINWMTAGRGIVHSERTPEDLRGVARRSHGLQLWAALPAADEETEPGFAHTPAPALPQLEIGGEPLGPRHVWWNFVSSRRERIVQAADDWAAQRLGAVPGETEFIPLPERRPG